MRKLTMIAALVAASVAVAACDPGEDVAEAACKGKSTSAECTQDPRCSWVVPEDPDGDPYCEARD